MIFQISNTSSICLVQGSSIVPFSPNCNSFHSMDVKIDELDQCLACFSQRMAYCYRRAIEERAAMSTKSCSDPRESQIYTLLNCLLMQSIQLCRALFRRHHKGTVIFSQAFARTPSICIICSDGSYQNAERRDVASHLFICSRASYFFNSEFD